MQSSQQPDGSFLTDTSPTIRLFRSVGQLGTTFTPALVLACLAGVAEAEPVRSKLARWLLSQKSANWSFNYWAVGAPQRTTRPYPDDLDDTFCALIALQRHDPAIIDGACLAKVVQLLIAAEDKVGGPYHTWLASKAAPAHWRDVDVAVNANIAYFLQSVARPISNVTVLLERAIRARDFSSPYYPSPFMVLYYIARAYQGPLTQELAHIIRAKKRKGDWGSPGRTALALTALHALGTPVDQQSVDYLLRTQHPDGSWPGEAFWLDEAHGSSKLYAGGAALTTAFVLEALALAQPQKSTKKNAKQSISKSYVQVINYAKAQTTNVEEPLGGQLRTLLGTMQAGDTNHEIALLPHMFAASLKSDLPRVAEPTPTRLGAANVFGWLAYTVYDDFLDGEGRVHQLSAANAALRRSLDNFRQALPEHTDFQHLVAQTFDRIDAANAWEIEYCRFEVTNQCIQVQALPVFGKPERVAEKSIGHMLTPLGVLARIGVSLTGKQAAAIQRGLTHYLAARQLNDDLHDWKTDVQNGHISYVVAAILQELTVQPGAFQLQDLLPKMERQFWRHTLTNICQATTRQLALARKAFKQSNLLNADSPLLQLVAALEQSMERTLQEQRKAIDFLNAYAR